MRQPVMNFSGELSPSEAAVDTAAADGGSTAVCLQPFQPHHHFYDKHLCKIISTILFQQCSA